MSRERFLYPTNPPRVGSVHWELSLCFPGSWESGIAPGERQDWLQQQLLRISQLFVSLSSSAVGIMWCH